MKIYKKCTSFNKQKLDQFEIVSAWPWNLIDHTKFTFRFHFQMFVFHAEKMRKFCQSISFVGQSPHVWIFIFFVFPFQIQQRLLIIVLSMLELYRIFWWLAPRSPVHCLRYIFDNVAASFMAKLRWWCAINYFGLIASMHNFQI